MTLEIMILELTKIQRQHGGDVPVRIIDQDACDWDDVKTVELRNVNLGPTKAVYIS
jgi:hypothetical protein